MKKLTCLYWAVIAACLPFLRSEAASRDSLTVNLYYSQSTPGDSLRLYIGDVFLINKSPDCFYPVSTGKKTFRFAVPVNAKCGYFWLAAKRRTTGPGDMQLIDFQFWEAGDSISLRISHRETAAGIYTTASFTGEGAVKYTLWEKMNNIRLEQMVSPKEFTGDLLQEIPDTLTLTEKYRLRFLTENQNLVSPLSYNVFRANLVYAAFHLKMSRMEVFLREHHLNKQDSLQFADRFKASFNPLKFGDISDEGLANSVEFVESTSRAFHLLGQLKGDHNSAAEFKEIVNSGLLQEVQETLIINYFIKSGRSKDLQPVYNDARKRFKDEANRNLLQQIWSRNAALPAGAVFTKLNGEKLSLSDLKGQVVLVDLWFNGCGGCAAYYASVLSKIEQSNLVKKGLKVLSINVDRNPATWKKALAENIYSSDHAINVYTNGQAFNHPFIKAFDISWLPTIILIDKHGKIAAYNTNELHHYDTLTKLLAKLM